MKTLIVQTAYIGDLVLTEPLIRYVRDKFGPPYLLVRESCLPLTSFMGKIFMAMGLKKNGGTLRSTIRIIRKIRKENFELVVSPHRSFRSAFIARNALNAVKIGYEDSAGFWFYDITVPYRKDFHEVKRMLSLLEAFTNEKYPLTPPRFYLEEGHKKIGKETLEHLGISYPFIAIFPGSRWNTKRWVEEGFIEVARILKAEGRNPVIIGSQEEKKLLEKIGRESDVPFISGIELYELVCMLTYSEAVIANDSGPMHIAVAIEKPVVAIFGPTTPSLGFYPLTKNSRVVEEKSLSCRPCGTHGGKKCPEGHFLCMRSITSEQVLNALREIL